MGFGKDGKGIIVRESTAFTLGALGAQANQLANGVQMDGDFRILRSDLQATCIGMTNAEGGGLALYMTEGDLTAAEVLSAIINDGPVDQGDRVAQEVSNRWVRRIAAASDTIGTERVLRNSENGPLISVKPRWTFPRRRTATEGGWNWVVFNNGEVLTTGATINVNAIHYGVWVS